MKRALLALTAGLMLLGLSACCSPCCDRPIRGALCHGSCRAAPELCRSCTGDPNCPHCLGGRGHHAAQQAVMPSVAYPYYTTHGPRDYFANNPSSIGP